MSNTITLYPSNWLYNAGVVGFLRVVERCGEKIDNFLKDDGIVKIPAISKNNVKDIFNKWQKLTEDRKYSFGGRKGYYSNQTKNSIQQRIMKFINIGCFLKRNKRKAAEMRCIFCASKTFKSNGSFYSQTFGNILPASQRTFKNSYWNNESKDFICSSCEFIVMCHHLSLTTLSDNSEIFINAPSFKLMWYLNKYAKEIIEKNKVKEVKYILGMSLIEMSRRLYVQLGIWTTMNIEVVSKYIDKIEFFALHPDIVRLIYDKEIASALSDIGEFKILNMVLDGRFDKILEMWERIFKIGLKSSNEIGKSDREFINKNIMLEKNRTNLTFFSQKLFKLYALINQKLKKEAAYGF